jgi:hypothetical protein
MEGDAHPAKLALRERRDRVIARLTDAFARDELGIDAFETRIAAAYRGQSEAELEALVADLSQRDASTPDAMVVVRTELVRAEAAAIERSGSHAGAAARLMARAIFSNVERRDRVVLAGTSRVEALFGNVEIDLRAASFASDVAELRVRSVFASIEILVPADVTVEVHGAAIFGNFEGATSVAADPDAPTLRIVGSAVFASVVVRTVPPLRVQKLAADLRARRLLPP